MKKTVLYVPSKKRMMRKEQRYRKSVIEYLMDCCMISSSWYTTVSKRVHRNLFLIGLGYDEPLITLLFGFKLLTVMSQYLSEPADRSASFGLLFF